MTNNISEFLKQDDNLILLNQGDFYTLFKKCPSLALRKELFEALQKANIPIYDSIHDKNTYYGIVTGNGNTLIIKDKKANDKYTLAWGKGGTSNKEDILKIVAFSDFKEALDAYLKYFGYSGDSFPVPLNPPFVEANEWKEVSLNSQDIKVLITQKCIDLFDPVKKREKRIIEAAKEEFNNRVRKFLSDTLSIKDDKDLIKELKELAINPDDVDIARFNTSIRIYIKYELMDTLKIKNIIKKYLKTSVDIITSESEKDFYIVPTKKKLNSIKTEIEDEFDVKI